MAASSDDPGPRLAELRERGVELIDARQVFVGPEVDLDRIGAGATLYPGVRLHGARTAVGRGARVGSEGPATLVDTVLDDETEVASGYLEGTVLLRGARAGANAHFRRVTLLEEQASTAHAVGLKHTLLLCFVTVGSLVNLCDALVGGGTSRRDHSEIGSGFVHFNFTPWGEAGDKATPTLVGDVCEGVFLRKPRIFLGGAGGIVGPRRVGFGSITAAGQVVRRDVPEGRVVSAPSPTVDREHGGTGPGSIARKVAANLAYVGELHALRAFYAEVRAARIEEGPKQRFHREAVAYAVELIDASIRERWARLEAFVRERGGVSPVVAAGRRTIAPCPLPLTGPEDHVQWVRSLTPGSVAEGVAWLQSVAAAPVPAPGAASA